MIDNGGGMGFNSFYPSTQEDLLWVDWFVLGYYLLIAVVVTGSLLFAIQIYRRRISWGQARVMGVPLAIYGWIQFMFLFVLFDGVFGIAAVLLSTPLWLDLLVAVFSMIIPLTIFIILKRRPTFKPRLFIALILIPLGIPGTHMLARLAKVGAVEIVGTAGVALVKYADDAAPFVVKHADEIVEVVPIVRNLPHVTATLAGKVRFANPTAKGRFGDALTARRMTALGYSKLPSKYNAINGIDGIYAKRGPNGAILELTIVENKVDGGRLFSNQMSDEWITAGLTKMAVSTDATARAAAREVQGLLKNQPHAVRKELWHHDLASGVTTVRSLDAHGRPGGILRTWNDSFIKNRLTETCKVGNLNCSFVIE